MIDKLPEINGWAIKKLRDLPKNQNDFVDGPFGSNLKVSDYTESGIRLIQLQNIEEGKFDDENKKYTSLKKSEQLKRHVAYPGDIAIAKMADPVGRACIIPDLEERYLVVADCIKLSVDKENYDPKFIMYMINSFIIRKQALMRSTGSTRLRINLGELKKISIPVPPLIEQRGIVEVLGTVDECIRLTDAVIERAEELKRGLMQQLLTRGIGHTEYKETPLGKIPKTWKTAKIDKIVRKLNSGITPRGGAENYIDSGIPFIRSQNVQMNQLDFSDVAYIPQKIHESMKNSVVKPNDVLLNITGASIGRVANVPVYIDEANVNQHVCRIRFKEDFNPIYMTYFLSSFLGQKQIMSFQAGGTRQGLNFEQLRSLVVPAPSFEEQTEITNILQSIDKKIMYDNMKREYIITLKDGLMQQLLSGKIRVELKGDGLHRIRDSRKANN